MLPVTDQSITNEVLSKINSQVNAVDNSRELGQEDFLSLMIAQVRHQDPFEPIENGEFIGQMAQFATVDGINQMQTSLSDLSKSLSSSQVLEAADLVGRSVLSATDTVHLDDQGGVQTSIAQTPGAGLITLDIFDAIGTLVTRRAINPRAEGNTPYIWDGLNDAGQRVAAGDYKLSAHALVDGENVAIATRASQRIESVSFGSGPSSLSLNLENGSRVAFTDVQEIL